MNMVKQNSSIVIATEVDGNYVKPFTIVLIM